MLTFLETQQLLPGYIDHLVARDNSVPSAGFYKGYNSVLFKDSTRGYDYLLSNGYISFQALKNTSHFNLDMDNIFGATDSDHYFIGSIYQLFLLKDQHKGMANQLSKFVRATYSKLHNTSTGI